MAFDAIIIRPAIGDLQEINDIEDRIAVLEEQVTAPVQAALDLKPDATTIDTIVTLTQAEYDALTPDDRTLYIVVEA